MRWEREGKEVQKGRERERESERGREREREREGARGEDAQRETGEGAGRSGGKTHKTYSSTLRQYDLLSM